jgi:hypothetical protein
MYATIGAIPAQTAALRLIVPNRQEIETAKMLDVMQFCGSYTMHLFLSNKEKYSTINSSQFGRMVCAPLQSHVHVPC